MEYIIFENENIPIFLWLTLYTTLGENSFFSETRRLINFDYVILLSEGEPFWLALVHEDGVVNGVWQV